MRVQPSPDVSVVVPCYNAAETLPYTLASVQAQTHENWEVVCVDDGSTDRTPELLDACARADSRFRWFRAPHAGLSTTRNRALAQARAAHVLFLDADDFARPEALATLAAVARVVGEHTIVCAGYQLLDQSARPLPTIRYPRVEHWSFDVVLRGCPLGPPLTLVPQAVLGSRPFDETLPAVEDWDLWLRLADAGVGCVSLPRVLFGYRLRMGSLSRQTDQMMDASRRVYEKWLPRAREPWRARDVLHRLASARGAVAYASGARDAIWRYFADLPPLEPTPNFYPAVAWGIAWAFEFVHGAAGETWRDHYHKWLQAIEEWLEESPLAAYADPILECLPHTDPIRECMPGADPEWSAALDLARNFLTRRPDARHLVVYGLGRNGARFLDSLRAAGRALPFELRVADDQVDPLAFAVQGLPRADPRQWRAWPTGTIAIVTPSECQAMCATLRRANGRDGIDFIALASAKQASSNAAGGHVPDPPGPLLPMRSADCSSNPSTPGMSLGRHAPERAVVR